VRKHPGYEEQGDTKLSSPSQGLSDRKKEVSSARQKHIRLTET
jgi:hypothetical protein